MLIRTVTALFLVTVFTVGGLGCAPTTVSKKDEPNATAEWDYSKVKPGSSVPLFKIVVIQEEEEDVGYCIDYDTKTGCPYPENHPKAGPYKCSDIFKKRLVIDDEFKLGSTNEPEDSGGPDAPYFMGDINSDMRCPVVKASHNPCQWIVIAGNAYGPLCW